MHQEAQTITKGDETMRMTVTLPDQLGERINEYKEQTGVPKGTLIQMAVTQYLDGQKMIESMPDFIQEMKKLVEENKKSETK